MVPLISYLSRMTSPAESVGTKEYSWPHFGQKPLSRWSGPSPEGKRRFRSGTVPGTGARGGSSGGSGGRASGRLPIVREPVRPLRVDPLRVERVERVLRPLREVGVRDEPVRV